MEFVNITEDIKASPGEYIFHVPTRQIVLCGAFNRTDNTIRVMSNGTLFSDKIQNFQKIKVNKRNERKMQYTRCKGCKK